MSDVQLPKFSPQRGTVAANRLVALRKRALDEIAALEEELRATERTFEIAFADQDAANRTRQRIADLVKQQTRI